MNTIQLQENVSFETYQKIVHFLEKIGVKIKTSNHPELTEQDLINIEISHKQVQEGKVVDNEVFLQELRSRYEN